MRRIITFPEDGPTTLAYGCSDCYWRYEPAVVDEVFSDVALWNAEVLFERHECERFKFRTVEPQKPAEERKPPVRLHAQYEVRQRRLRKLWRKYRP